LPSPHALGRPERDAAHDSFIDEEGGSMNVVLREVIRCSFCPNHYAVDVMLSFGNGMICPSCERRLIDGTERAATRYQPAGINRLSTGYVDNLRPIARHRPEPVELKRKKIDWPFVGFWGLYGGVLLALCFWWGRWLFK
jgi:hypothetical protein